MGGGGGERGGGADTRWVYLETERLEFYSTLGNSSASLTFMEAKYQKQLFARHDVNFQGGWAKNCQAKEKETKHCVNPGRFARTPGT